MLGIAGMLVDGAAGPVFEVDEWQRAAQRAADSF